MPQTRMTARAAIQEEALRLFAEHGADTVSLRQVAAAAGVSPALVVHHFGGKNGLRAAVDEHTVGICEEILSAEVARMPAAGSGVSMTEALLRRLPQDSPVPTYLRRLLLSGDQAGERIFLRWYDACGALLEKMADAGLVHPGDDRAVRTALLVANDLAVLLLRDQLIRALGTDPLSPAGLTRWAGETTAVYHGDLFSARADDEEP